MKQYFRTEKECIEHFLLVRYIPREEYDIFCNLYNELPVRVEIKNLENNESFWMYRDVFDRLLIKPGDEFHLSNGLAVKPVKKRHSSEEIIKIMSSNLNVLDLIILDTYSNAQKLSWQEIESNCKEALKIIKNTKEIIEE